MKTHSATKLMMAIILSAIIPSAAFASNGAENISGEISVSLNVLPGCVVKTAQSMNESSSFADGQKWMTLAFPETGATAGAELKTQDKMNIQCTANANPSLVLDGGQHSDDDKRNMLNANGTTKLPYILTSDAEGKNIIEPNKTINVTSSGDFALYAKTTVPPNTQSGLYNDTINATLSW